MKFDLDNMYCGAIRRGDIFVYQNAKDSEQPVVVLQDNVLNDSLPTVLGALVFPHQRGDKVFINEVKLPKEESGLGKDGVCMMHQIVTIDRRHMRTKKGELSTERLKELYQALDNNLGRFRDK